MYVGYLCTNIPQISISHQLKIEYIRYDISIYVGEVNIIINPT